MPIEGKDWSIVGGAILGAFGAKTLRKATQPLSGPREAAGDPVASVPLREEDAVTQMEWEGYLKEKVAWSSKYNRGSVLGHDDFEVRHEDVFAAPFPTETPHYVGDLACIMRT